MGKRAPPATMPAMPWSNERQRNKARPQPVPDKRVPIRCCGTEDKAGRERRREGLIPRRRPRRVQVSRIHSYRRRAAARELPTDWIATVRVRVSLRCAVSLLLYEASKKRSDGPVFLLPLRGWVLGKCGIARRYQAGKNRDCQR